MADKEQISGVKGTIKSIFKSNSGTTAQGKDWAVQDFDLTDNQVTIKVKVWNHPPIPTTAKGSAVTLLSHSGEKGLSGLYAHDDEYNGKVTRQIKVTDTGEVVIGAGSVPAAAPAAAQSAPALTPEQQAKQDAVKAGHYIMQCANLLERNLDAAAWVAARFNAKHANFKKMDTEDVRTMAMSLQIACERNGVQNLMPTAAPKAEGGK